MTSGDEDAGANDTLTNGKGEAVEKAEEVKEKKEEEKKEVEEVKEKEKNGETKKDDAKALINGDATTVETEEDSKEDAKEMQKKEESMEKSATVQESGAREVIEGEDKGRSGSASDKDGDGGGGDAGSDWDEGNDDGGGGGGGNDMDDVKQKQALKAAFDIFDVDGSGAISAAEFGTAMRAMGQNPTDQEVEALLKTVDRDLDGSLNFSEFTELMTSRLLERKDVDEDEMFRQAFRVFDKDKSGRISREELRNVLTSYGQMKLTEEDADDMLARADADGDNQIDYEEFVKMFTETMA